MSDVLKSRPRFGPLGRICYLRPARFFTMKALNSLLAPLGSLLRLVLPQRCCLCGRRLSETESTMCPSCFASLPLTRLRGRSGNVVERLFWGRLPIERANAFMYYYADAASALPIAALKYRQRPDVGVWFGRVMAADLLDSDFFRGIDAIVPVPLARDRQRQRGYNQSERLAEGVSRLTHLPVWTDLVERHVSNPTQTRLGPAERRRNVENIFRLLQPAKAAHRHLLLVDDVLTTGATLHSCAVELAKAPGVRISILALALAGPHSDADVPARQYTGGIPNF